MDILSDDNLKKLKELREILIECLDDINSWGAYADKYSQDKYGLQGDLNRVEKAIQALDEFIKKNE